jgi:hypothetical protein
MKTREKRSRAHRPSKAAKGNSGVFDVPSHGRLARRGSTEVVDDQPTGRRGASERASDAST